LKLKDNSRWGRKCFSHIKITTFVKQKIFLKIQNSGKIQMDLFKQLFEMLRILGGKKKIKTMLPSLKIQEGRTKVSIIFIEFG
jgi:hypothetical protein